MPYEEITQKEYDKMVSELSFLSFRQVKGNEAEVEKFCNNDTCELDFGTPVDSEEEANKRMDVVGQNGNDGLHYEETEKVK